MVGHAAERLTDVRVFRGATWVKHESMLML